MRCSTTAARSTNISATALMATFGTPSPGPLDATSAIAATRQLLRELERAGTGTREAKGERRIRIGVGLHFGVATLGDVGTDAALRADGGRRHRQHRQPHRAAEPPGPHRRGGERRPDPARDRGSRPGSRRRLPRPRRTPRPRPPDADPPVGPQRGIAEAVRSLSTPASAPAARGSAAHSRSPSPAPAAPA